MPRLVWFLALVMSLALVRPGLAQPVPGGRRRGMDSQLYNPENQGHEASG
jgi:hypothetical protein